MKIFIDPACDIHYASFYISGLVALYGKKNVTFSSKYFKSFKHNNHFFAFVLEEDAKIQKIVVDFTDSSIIDQNALAWCDCYGKINLDDTLGVSTKVIPIGPSFGIQIFSLAETLWYASVNLLKAFNRIPNKRRFLADYRSQFKRPKLLDYNNLKPKDNYVFFMASLWKQEPLTNQYRANFIAVCKEHPNIDFEGGFAPRKKQDITGFERFTKASRIGMDDYLKNMKASSIAFNTPAVKGCHGWKLAEYLCLGKAIVSTPLKRILPCELRDGEQLLFTDGSKKDIRDRSDTLMDNDVLRRSLERNAHDYYNTYLAPKQVIRKLLDRC